MKEVEPGRYKLRVRAFWRGENGFDKASLIVSWQEDTDQRLTQKLAGGLRIKKITDYPGDLNSPPIVRKYAYQMIDGRSSGVIYQEPKYVYEHSTYQGLSELVEIECDYYYRLARSVAATSLTQGSHVGYRRVVESFGENGENGYSVRAFTHPLQYPDGINSTPPFAPPSSQSYRTGLETYHEQYASNDKKVQVDTTQYTFSEYSIPTLKVGFRGGNEGPGLLNKYDIAPYQLKAGHHQIKETYQQVVASEGDQGHEQRSYYNYDAPLQNLLQSETTDSEGRPRTATYQYAEQADNQTLIDRG